VSTLNIGLYRYETDAIAADAFGQLFQGVTTASEQPVFMKALSGKREEGDMDRQIRSWQTIKHPNLLLPIDTVSQRGANYTILPNPGGELLDRCLPELLAKGIQGRHRLLMALVDVCKGVEALHGVGIVHGQINPSNVVLGSEVQRQSWLLLADRFVPKNAGEYIAFPRYLSYVPQEQLRGAGSFQADIYALAMLVYASFVQSEAIEPPSGYERAERAVWGEVLPFTANLDGLGANIIDALSLELETLAAVVAKGIQRNPAARYMTVVELRRAIEELSRRMAPLAVGQRLCREKRFVEAAAVFEQAATGPQAVLAQVLLGRTLGLDLGNYEAGIISLRRALKSSPELDSARLALAEIYLRQERYPMAKREYETMLAVQPNEFQLLAGYANVLFASGNPEGALNILRKVREQNPYHLSAHISTIRIALGAGLMQDAERDSKLAVTRVAEVVKKGNLNPKEVAEVYYLRAAVLSRLGHDDHAIRWAEKALEFDPLHAQSHRLLAMIFRSAGQIESAIAHFVELVRTSPTSDEGIVAALGRFLSEHADPSDTMSGRTPGG
jgi:tetratricopeptide (TPR) repeat protein